MNCELDSSRYLRVPHFSLSILPAMLLLLLLLLYSLSHHQSLFVHGQAMSVVSLTDSSQCAQPELVSSTATGDLLFACRIRWPASGYGTGRLMRLRSAPPQSQISILLDGCSSMAIAAPFADSVYLACGTLGVYAFTLDAFSAGATSSRTLLNSSMCSGAADVVLTPTSLLPNAINHIIYVACTGGGVFELVVRRGGGVLTSRQVLSSCSSVTRVQVSADGGTLYAHCDLGLTAVPLISVNTNNTLPRFDLTAAGSCGNYAPSGFMSWTPSIPSQLVLPCSVWTTYMANTMFTVAVFNTTLLSPPTPLLPTGVSCNPALNVVFWKSSNSNISLPLVPCISGDVILIDGSSSRQFVPASSCASPMHISVSAVHGSMLLACNDGNFLIVASTPNFAAVMSSPSTCDTLASVSYNNGTLYGSCMDGVRALTGVAPYFASTSNNRLASIAELSFCMASSFVQYPSGRYIAVCNNVAGTNNVYTNGAVPLINTTIGPNVYAVALRNFSYIAFNCPTGVWVVKSADTTTPAYVNLGQDGYINGAQHMFMAVSGQVIVAGRAVELFAEGMAMRTVIDGLSCPSTNQLSASQTFLYIACSSGTRAVSLKDLSTVSYISGCGGAVAASTTSPNVYVGCSTGVLVYNELTGMMATLLLASRLTSINFLTLAANDTALYVVGGVVSSIAANGGHATAIVLVVDTRILVPCPPGWQLDFSSSAVSVCIPCALGQNRSALSSVAGVESCAACPSVAYAPLVGFADCLPCSAGQFPLSGLVCATCAPGTAAVTAGLATCTPCGVGTYQDQTMGSTCKSCSRGYYQPFSVGAVCLLCGEGTFANTTGQSSCYSCPRGYFSSSTASWNCTVCEAGTYQANVGSLSCQPCPQGTFSPTSGASRCTSCPLNTFSNSTTTGLSSCYACAVGTSTSSVGSVSCVGCSEGRFWNGSAVGCVDCGGGTYQPASGQTSCLPCSIGYYAPSGINPACIVCPRGTFAPTTGSASCTPCPIGTIGNDTALAACYNCPFGTSTEALGSVACVGCQSGRYAVVSTTSNQTICTDCPAGRYQHQSGQTSCDPCPIGTAVDAGVNPICQSCARGQIANTTGLKQCEPCPQGRYSNVSQGASSCFDCAPFTYAPQEGYQFCLSCPSNSYSFLNASTSCMSCSLLEAGSYVCDNGQIEAARGWYLFTEPQQETDGTTSIEAFTVLCASSTMCVGGPLDAQCSANRKPPAINALCGACSDGFVEWSGQCVMCDAVNGGRLTLVLLGCLVYVIVIHANAAAPDGALSAFLYFLQTALFLASSPAAWLNWLNVLSLSPLVAMDGGSDCVLPLTPMQTLAVGVVASVVFFLLLATLCGLHWCMSQLVLRCKCNNGNNINAMKCWDLVVSIVGPWRLSPYLRTAVYLLLFAYAQVSSAVLLYLQCVNVAGKRLVYTEPAISCDSDEYKRWLPVVVLLLVFYVVGLPVLLLVFFFVRRHDIVAVVKSGLLLNKLPEEKEEEERERLQEREKGEQQLEQGPVKFGKHDTKKVGGIGVGGGVQLSESQQRFSVRWGVLFSSYRSSCFYWHAIVLVRRTVVITVYTSMYALPVERQAVIQFIHAVSLVVQLWQRPFAHRFTNIIETIGLALLIVMATVLCVHPLQPYTTTQQVLLTLTILVPSLIFVTLIVTRTLGEHSQKLAKQLFLTQVAHYVEKMKQLMVEAEPDHDTNTTANVAATVSNGTGMGVVMAHSTSSETTANRRLQTWARDALPSGKGDTTATVSSGGMGMIELEEQTSTMTADGTHSAATASVPLQTHSQTHESLPPASALTVPHVSRALSWNVNLLRQQNEVSS